MIITKVFRYFATELLRNLGTKSHDVQMQMVYATLYGLIDIYGFSGALTIILKARKMGKPGNRVTVKPVIRAKDTK